MRFSSPRLERPDTAYFAATPLITIPSLSNAAAILGLGEKFGAKCLYGNRELPRIGEACFSRYGEFSRKFDHSPVRPSVQTLNPMGESLGVSHDPSARQTIKKPTAALKFTLRIGLAIQRGKS
ncbi:hypothetical protein AVEN_95467-1 [Araneus ventricosus]|uniref:Uncharacterized protein n=1 Tax=Araneus ventricosus TaxID=182803 RepID=A0A4Y2JJ58_ARAVE|nr:hypothetical protein AVEN_95467-1 [Araneus ventricosus]